MLRMIGYMNLVYEGGQKDDFIEALQKLYRNRQKKVVSCVNGCLTRYDAAFHGLTSSLRTPKIFIKEFGDFLMSCHQHCLGVNLLVQR